MLQCKSFSFIKIPKYFFFFKKGQPAAVWKNTTRSHNPEDKIALKIVLMSQPGKKKQNISTHPSICLSLHSSINLANNNQAPLVCQTPSCCGGQCPILVCKKYADACEWRQVNKRSVMIVVSQAPGSTLSLLLLFSH